MPASLVRATLAPAATRLQDHGPHFRRIVIMIGLQLFPNPIAGQQFCSDTGVLAEYHVGRGQRLERPQGDVFR